MTSNLRVTIKTYVPLNDDRNIIEDLYACGIADMQISSETEMAHVFSDIADRMAVRPVGQTLTIDMPAEDLKYLVLLGLVDKHNLTCLQYYSRT